MRVTGTVRRVRATGPGGAPVLRAELGGCEGSVTIIWFGRDHITGIEPGRVVAVEGTLSVQRGRRVIYNPRYELVHCPAANERGRGGPGAVAGAA